MKIKTRKKPDSEKVLGFAYVTRSSKTGLGYRQILLDLWIKEVDVKFSKHFWLNTLTKVEKILTKTRTLLSRR